MSLCFAEEYSEPITLKTEINGVSGYPGFGLGLFPASTSFQYLRSDIKLFEDAPFDSKLYFYITYGFSNVNRYGSYITLTLALHKIPSNFPLC